MGIKRDEEASVFNLVYEESVGAIYKIAMKYSANHFIAEEIVHLLRNGWPLRLKIWR